MNQKLKGINNCKFCGKQYEMGFYGAGPKYCSHKCNRKGRAIEDKLRHGKRYVRKDKDCKVCGRSIMKVGLRKFTNKYCSNKCMNLAQRMKEGRKYCTIKIPVKDLPLFFGQIK
tara:strand:+ start:868 stop:1209 length:342 start_codon:yes stop_codon:yes gene_type:complete